MCVCVCVCVCVQVEKEEIDSLIPKGVSELTKQQIRYLLQVRAYRQMMNVCLAHFHSAPPTSQYTPPSDTCPDSSRLFVYESVSGTLFPPGTTERHCFFHLGVQ